jgi:glutamyl-tRNA synthetase
MIRTRIAPSPTGEDLHIGNLHTALINWAYASKNSGQFIIRIEDTDKNRLIKGSEEKILQTLKNYGLDYDEGPDIEGRYGPYRQSERLEIYDSYIKELLDKKFAYYCFCSKERLDDLRKKQIKGKKVPKYDKHCLNSVKNSEKRIENGEKYVIRLNVKSGKKIEFEDAIRGKIIFESNNIDDQILIKSDGYPTYHFAVVIDDHLMGITHVIRGEEWISSTPKHIILYDAFGWEKPIFAHTPLLRNPDKSKLSKRKNPVWASWYLKQGYLPRAVLNYLALMGWSHPKQKEVFTMDEFINVFDLKDMKAVGPAFDPVKLEWMNGEHIRALEIDDLKTRISNFIGKEYDEKIILKTIPIIRERIKKLSDYLPLCDFFFEKPKKFEINIKQYKNLFKKISNTLSELKDWKAGLIGEHLINLAKSEKIKTGDFFMYLRVAITGKKISPPLNESMEILGKDECLKRIEDIK